MPRVTDIRMHQASSFLEVAFDTGEVFKLPYKIKSLEPIGNEAINLTFKNGKQQRYDWQQLYEAAKQTLPDK